ncbi:MAG: DNA-processing protein DprA [Selenomonadaceae bacterium]|nr:DNA-processing protein DprA [Selenomonadaceae bacterium]
MEKYYMAAMGGAEGFGNKSIAHLVEFFGSAKAAWFAKADELIQSGVRKNFIGAFITFRQGHPDAPEKLVGYCERQKIKLCCINDEDYPPILKEINSPPMFFYYRGTLQPQAFRIGIVGSRHNTAYGQNVALELGEQLAAAGITVVSGAARGIDSFAHRGALKSGRTVAVLGCGINYIFPRENRKLFEEIAERGVVLSEFPPNLTPNAGTFPTRNRIIAGLSKGVVVVEADFRSGALITSNYANEYDRDVFAVPGQVYAKMSRGCNELIRDGAILIKGAQDILNEYDILATDEAVDKPTKTIDKPEPKITLEGTAARVLEMIPFDRYITDEELIEKLDDINPSELPGIMLELDLKGCVEEDAGRYKRKVGG